VVSVLSQLEITYILLHTAFQSSQMTSCKAIVGIVILIGIELGLWCLTPLSTIFQLYRGGQFFIGGGNRSNRTKP
jgi:hypothetical protein